MHSLVVKIDGDDRRWALSGEELRVLSGTNSGDALATRKGAGGRARDGEDDGVINVDDASTAAAEFAKQEASAEKP